MNKPVIVEKYGVEVWCNPEMDLRRQQECLCLNCGRLNFGCKQSSLLWAKCKVFNLAIMITRCPDWQIPLEG